MTDQPTALALSAVFADLDTKSLDGRLAAGALIDGAIVITRLHTVEDGAILHVAASPGLDWITKRGMLAIANEIEGVEDPDGDE